MAEINLKWKEGMSFTAEIEGHEIVVDAAPDFGGMEKGPRPKPLMLAALAGCTGMDVVSILNKMKVDYKSLNIRVSSEMTDQHPKVYKNFHIIYEFEGDDLPLPKIEKAITLSQENYCGVSAMYKQFAELTYEIVLK